MARRISYQSQRSFSKVILRLGVIAVALSIATMIVSDSIVIGFQSEIKHKITSFCGHIQVSKTRTTAAFENEPLEYDSNFVQKVSQIPQVSHVQVFATKPGIIKTTDEIEGVVVKGVGSDYDWKYFEKNIISGRKLNLSDSMAANEIMLSKTTATKLNLKAGDSILMYFIQQPLRVRKFLIAGIYSTNIEEIDKVYVLADIRHIQILNGWSAHEVGGYHIFIKDLEKVDQVNDKVRFMTDISEDSLTIKDRFPQIFDWLNLLNVNIKIILILMAIVAVINMVTVLIIMILERTQMVGILKALGARNFQLQKVFIYNAGILIGLGMVVGNILGLGLMFVQYKYHIITLPSESYYLTEVPVAFNWMHALLINGAAFIFCSIAMLLPSTLVNRILPVKAIRFD